MLAKITAIEVIEVMGFIFGICCEAHRPDAHTIAAIGFSNITQLSD